jgi:hypothetical protein
MNVIIDTRRGAKLDIDVIILMYELFDKTNLRITIQWPKEEGQTIQWSKEEEQTIQWSKEDGQIIQWPKEEERTIQW